MADLKDFAEQLVNLTVKEVKELADILKRENPSGAEWLNLQVRNMEEVNETYKKENK